MTADGLRRSVLELIRALRLLDETKTPCGQAISLREGQALLLLRSREDEGEAFSQSELQEALGIDKSNITRLVARLVEDGRVIQRRGETDARMRTLRLTSRGRALARELEESTSALYTSIWRRIEPSQRSQIGSSLAALTATIRDVLASRFDLEDAPG